jgi:hypothetical protein
MEPTDSKPAAQPGVGDTTTQSAEDWLKLSRVHQQQGRLRQAIIAAANAVRIAPGNLDARFHEIDCLIVGGQTRAARDRLAGIEKACGDDATRLAQVGEVYARFNGFRDADRCYARAHELAPQDRNAHLSLARSQLALGDLARAEQLLNEATSTWPRDPEAWHTLARLKTWSASTNHVETLERLVAEAPDPVSTVPLCYALHKELEDLGEDERAMSWLQRGARTLRGTFSYRVEGDAAIMASIARTFPAARLRGAATSGAGEGAIFVIGLPRSGTTLVDRILSAHPTVESLGELRDLTFAVMRAGDTGDAPRSGPASRPAQPDLGAIGQSYLEAVSAYRGDRPCFVDKAPTNFLYAGLIRLALPGARIVMLRRDPMDSCLAIYKTLFREGFPFASSLEDLGRYYVAWDRLAAHWRDALQGSVLEVSYESLVGDQEAETRRLLEYCGLDWDPRCLEFHLNASPSATASAAQVRQAMYGSSVGRWKKHEKELEPLVRILKDAGISVS